MVTEHAWVYSALLKGIRFFSECSTLHHNVIWLDSYFSTKQSNRKIPPMYGNELIQNSYKVVIYLI